MPEVTTSSGGNPIVAQIYSAKSSAELQSLYNAWATKYNQDLSDQDYQAPLHTAQAVLQHSHNPENVHSAFDAGCGTGLSGLALKSILPNLKVLDGVDLSTGMLEQARQTKIYTSLATADLTKSISCEDNTYDAVICVGTLTHGHVGPLPALAEFVRIVKEGTGIVAVTILDDIWESERFRQEVERLEEEKKVIVLARESMPYRRAAGVNARVVVLRKF